MRPDQLKTEQRQVIIHKILTSPNLEAALRKEDIDVEWLAQLIALEGKEVFKAKKAGKQVQDSRYRHLVDSMFKIIFHKENNEISEKATKDHLAAGNLAVMDELRRLMRSPDVRRDN